MSTRESMRRELRELAKLAETKRQEQAKTKTPRSSGEWSYVDPADAPTPAPPPEKADESVFGTTGPVETLDPPSWPSSATVPPVVPQAGFPSTPGDLLDLSAKPASGRHASRWLMVGVAAVVLACAGIVGRQLHGNPAQAAAVAAPPPAVAETPAPPPAREPEPTAPAAAPEPAPVVAAASAATAPANPPSRRSGGAAPRPARTVHAVSVPAKAVAQAKPAAAPAANHTDSLDDLMRKAVNAK